jgi:hypothetical protein
MATGPTLQQDTTDIFHRSKALLIELRQEIWLNKHKKKLKEVQTNLELMYGQLALLEDQGHTGVDQEYDLHDPIEEGDESW